MTTESKRDEIKEHMDAVRVEGLELIDKMMAVFSGYRLTSIAIAISSILEATPDIKRELLRVEMIRLAEKAHQAAENCRCEKCVAERAKRPQA